MSKERKNAAPVGKTGTAERTTALSEPMSKPDFNMEGIVSSILLNGEENALISAELARLLEMPERKIRKQILSERLSGSPICSSGRGYFLAECPEDLRRCSKSLRRRSREVDTTAAALEVIAARLEGQDRVQEKEV